MHPPTSVVLLSGGIDSTTALAVATATTTPVLALSVDYGQRHRREVDAAARVASHYRVPHTVLDLTGWGGLLTGSALTDTTVAVPDGGDMGPGASDTVVPNRNAVLLMSAVGIAQSRGASEVWVAVHAGDHTVYPDCRPEFIEAADRTARVATEGRVRIVAPFVRSTKADIVRVAGQVGAPLHLSWSCYEGGGTHCGRCGACRGRRAGFQEAGVVDPTVYLSDGLDTVCSI